MALSYTEITLGAGTGENGHLGTVFGPFSFEYLSTDDIKVQVRAAAGTTWTTLAINTGVDTNGINTTTKKVTLSATPNATASSVATDVIRIFRSSSLEALVDFQNGSRLSEADLDSAYRQGLFAAQEAVEDAPGSSGRTVQASEDIADGAIIASKLASTLDLSGKTLTLPAASVTTHVPAGVPSLSTGYSGVLPTNRGGTGSANATYCNLASNVTGTLPVANGGTGLSADTGRVLEEFLSPCDGGTVNLTGGRQEVVATVAAEQDLPHADYEDVTGSTIIYTPPSGAQFVIYKFITNVSAHDGNWTRASFKLWLDGVEVTDFRTSVRAESLDYGRKTFEWSFPIGGVAAAATGRVNTWTSDKTIKLSARDWSEAYDVSLHTTWSWEEAEGEAQKQFSRPLIGIKAIG